MFMKSGYGNGNPINRVRSTRLHKLFRRGNDTKIANAGGNVELLTWDAEGNQSVANGTFAACCLAVRKWLPAKFIFAVCA